MKKIIFLIVWCISILSADSFEVKQNFKALYRDVELSEYAKEYIESNQYENIKKIKKILEKRKYTLDKKYINDKSVIEYTLQQDGEIKDIKFLKKSNSYELDKFTKRVIKEASKKFPQPKEDILMRYIIYFDIGKDKTQQHKNLKSSIDDGYSKYKYISKGTTRFHHRSEEYIRRFETQKDGFVNINIGPSSCMKQITLLKDNNERVAIVPSYSQIFNKEIMKGKYKLLIKTKTDCDLSIQYN